MVRKSNFAKKEGYGPTGNGLILHSTLAIEPEKGQTLGLLWQKLYSLILYLERRREKIQDTVNG